MRLLFVLLTGKYSIVFLILYLSFLIIEDSRVIKSLRECCSILFSLVNDVICSWQSSGSRTTPGFLHVKSLWENLASRPDHLFLSPVSLLAVYMLGLPLFSVFSFILNNSFIHSGWSSQHYIVLRQNLPKVISKDKMDYYSELFVTPSLDHNAFLILNLLL